MSRWWSTLMTHEDGRADTMMTLTVLGVLAFIGQSIYAVVWQHDPWRAFDYGAGFGAVIAAAATGMGLRIKLSASATGVVAGGSDAPPPPQPMPPGVGPSGMGPTLN